MTFVFTIQTPKSIWLVADRRLSAAGKAPIDDATKVTTLETSDGHALVSYAGLGATALGNQPSSWVRNVLRGRNFPLEQSLGLLAKAMQREFLPHLSQIKNAQYRQHSFLIPAIVNGKHRIYTIDLVGSRNEYRFRYTRHIMGGALLPLQITPPVGVAGSGQAALHPMAHTVRPIMQLVKAFNNKKVSADVVCNRLAELSFRAYQLTADGSVGPRCIVVWRYSNGGGASAHYSGLTRDSHSPILPSIALGLDSGALVAMTLEVMSPWMNQAEVGKEVTLPESANTEIDARLRKLPHKPDEKLR
jgi:hypothetical protein